MTVECVIETLDAEARGDLLRPDDESVDWARASYDALTEYSTDGTYVNFISGEAGEEHTAYRENSDRSVELKAEDGTENRFRLNQNMDPRGWIEGGRDD